MSNRPKLTPKKVTKPKTYQKLNNPCKLRFYHHVGDMAGCGTIRVIQPAMILNNYYSKEYQFESIFNNRYTPFSNAYRDNSFVTFQRSAGKQQLDMVKHFKKMNPGKACIYEIDDNLFDIPKWNFASKFYTENADSIKRILSMMDGIICSTPQLKKLLSKYNPNINVSPNHLPKFIWGDVVAPDKLEQPDKIRIMYAGSHNHFDLNGTNQGDFSDTLIDFVSKTTDKYQWIFVGGIPHTLKGNKDIIHHEWKPVIEYPSFLKSLQPDIFLAPLEVNDFNKCKSNIKALEAVALGVPLVSTFIEPYSNLVYNAETDDYFISLIEKLAGSADTRHNVWNCQYTTLKNQLFWEDNNYTNMFDYVNQHLRLLGKEL